MNMLQNIGSNQMLIILITFAIASISQSYLNSTFNKYSKIRTRGNLTGIEVAQKIMRANGVYDVKIEEVKTNLGDHFDPKNKVVRLSPAIGNGTSIASNAVAAHEIGHVLQYHQGSKLILIRNAFLPLAQIGSKLMWIALFGGLILQVFGLVLLGIILFTGVLLFQVATLPVEFDASKRARQQLINLNIIDHNELEGVGKTLNAAALTYVAGVITSLLTLLRFLQLASRR